MMKIIKIQDKSLQFFAFQRFKGQIQPTHGVGQAITCVFFTQVHSQDIHDGAVIKLNVTSSRCTQRSMV